MDKLKPCPFCGSEAAEPVFIGNEHTKKRTITIKCKAPGCTKGVTVGALRFSHEWCHAEAVKKWNTRATDTYLAEAEARIAELLAREQREAERRKKQGVILDHAMRGLRNSAEHPDDGRMQAVRALAQHSEKQAGRIASLEKALEPFAEAYRHAEKQGATNRYPHAFEEFRRAAALLKEKE